jgi:hypothetical protein
MWILLTFRAVCPKAAKYSVLMFLLALFLL